MPVIVAPANYQGWISSNETDPRDLMAPFVSDLMRILADLDAVEFTSE